MKTKLTKIKLKFGLLLVLLFPLSLLAAPLAYVCGAGQVTLKYTGAYTLQNGDRVFWQEVTDVTGDVSVGSPTEITSAGVVDDGNLMLTGTSIAAGEHFYKMFVLTALPGGCTGDVSDVISIYKLPDFTVMLTPDIDTYCATGTTNITKATVTASTTLEAGAPALPGDVTFIYDWAGSTGGAMGANNTYIMSTSTAGTYSVTAKATFVLPAGATLKTATGVPCENTGSTTIKVSETPGKPSITVS